MNNKGVTLYLIIVACVMLVLSNSDDVFIKTYVATTTIGLICIGVYAVIRHMYRK